MSKEVAPEDRMDQRLTVKVSPNFISRMTGFADAQGFPPSTSTIVRAALEEYLTKYGH